MQELSKDDKHVILGNKLNAKTGTVVDFTISNTKEKTYLVNF